MQSIEVKLHEALDTIAHHEREIISLRGELHQARLLVAQVELEERIHHLPFESRERLRRAFSNTDLGGLKQAVRIEERHANTYIRV